MSVRGRKRPGVVWAYQAGKAGDSPLERLRARRLQLLQARKAKRKKAAAESRPASASRSAPRLVRDRRGLVRLEGCAVPVWRLEMARRAGSTPDALVKAFPGLTPPGLDLALAYARRHRKTMDQQIRAYGPAVVPPAVEADDGEGFEEELGALLDRNAELYRRLAR